jgi:hypothetical protein
MKDFVQVFSFSYFSVTGIAVDIVVTVASVVVTVASFLAGSTSNKAFFQSLCSLYFNKISKT